MRRLEMYQTVRGATQARAAYKSASDIVGLGKQEVLIFMP